nr:MAG TPA: putative excisionase [Caudoviricetes sp.]
MISVIGMLAAMVSMTLAACSLALAVVVYRRVRGSATSRQETAQTAPATGVPTAVVAAGGGAVDGSLGWPIIARWFGRPAVSLDAWSARLVASCLRAVGERLLSGRVPVGCWPCVWQCRGSLLVMRRLVWLWPLVAAWAGWCLATCRVVGRGPPAYGVRLLSLIAAATTPYKPKNRGLAQSRLLAPVVKPLKGRHMNHITTPQLPQWLTTAQAATLSGFSQWQIRKFCRQGVLRATQPSMATTVGRNAPYRIALADLTAFMDAHPVADQEGYRHAGFYR